MGRRKASRKRGKDGPNWLKRWWQDGDPQQRKVVALWLGKFLIVIGIIAVAGVGLKYLEGYVKDVNRQRQVQLSVELAHTPAWAGPELIEQVCLSTGVKSDDFLLNDDLVKQWAAHLSDNPWVKEIHHIQKRYDGRIVIDCELRRPIAMVRQHNRNVFVDSQGMVLPEMEVYGHLVQLQGELSRLPEPGHIVSSKSVKAGLDVLNLIRQVDEQLPGKERLWSQLFVMDVSNYEGRVDKSRPHLRLYTKNQTEIRWGAALGRERPYYEAPPKSKLASLYRAFKQTGSLDHYQYVELRDLRKERSDPLRRG